MTLGAVTADLRPCSGCGWFAHWLSAQRRCAMCLNGWRISAAGRLVWDDGTGRRVTVAEVVAAVPDTRRSSA
jgi:hypothetical protein